MDLDSICLDAECLLSLEQGQHLNDEIINTTFHLLLTSSNKKDEVVDYVSPHVFETYKKNKEGDQGMLFVDERRTFLHATNFAVILFPLCFDKHWILVIYHKPMKSIVYFDSGRQIFGNDKIMEIISQYLAYLIPETKGAAKLVQKGWTQKDDSSCGVYILYYAFCFLRCVTLHNTDFLTFDPKSRQQLKGALEKRKLTGIARLIFPKTQSGGATTHKSVKHFMAMNCVPLEDYFKSPTAYDSDPENEMISKGFPNNGESPAVPFTPMEKEKITIRIKKDNPNFQSYSNSNNSISSNFSPNTVNGDTSRSMNNFSSRGTTPGGSPTRQPESSTVGKRISMVSNQSTPSPPHKQESFPKATSESLPSGAQRIQMNQQTHSISSNQRTSTTNHHNEHMNQNSSNASYTIHRNAPNNSVPINHINNLSPQHKNKRKDNEEIDLESRPKKLNSVPIRTDASSTKASKEVVIDDLLQFFREKYGEDRPFCPIINSSVTIKLGENTIDSKSAPSEDKGIQCELVPNALFKMIKWKMVDGQVALIFND